MFKIRVTCGFIWIYNILKNKEVLISANYFLHKSQFTKLESEHRGSYDTVPPKGPKSVSLVMLGLEPTNVLIITPEPCVMEQMYKFRKTH